MKKTIVSIKNMHKYYGEYHALRDINLEIMEGEFFSLLGPSGCGKTTLLRTISGFEQPSSGSLLIDGVDMADVTPDQRPTKMMFQSYAIFPHLSVGDNVGYGLRRVAKDERVMRVNEALDMVGLKHLANRRPHELSGGQRQRVALARGLVMKPKVMLLDEPLSALDKKLREQMQVELRKLQRDIGITFVMVTHDQEEALTLSDRIAVMFQGVIAQADSPFVMYSAPKTRAVAEFIGLMNFLPCECLSDNGATISLNITGLGRRDLPKPENFNKNAVQVGVRPEQFSILTDTGLKTDEQVTGKVVENYYYGDLTYYDVAVEGINKPLSISMRNTAGRRVYAVGEMVEVGWSEKSMVVLSA